MIKNLAAWLASKARTKTCTTLVVHATAGGNLSGAISTLKLKGFSYHFLIDKNGSIWKAAPYTRAAYHAGKSEGPQGPNVNDYSVGVCFVNRNDGKDPITDAQLAALEDLTMILKKHIPTLKCTTTHFGISWGRKFDPKLFDIQAFGTKVGLIPWKLARATWRLF